MGNNSSAFPDIGLLRCDCGYQHGRIDGYNSSVGSSTAPLFSSPEPTPPLSKRALSLKYDAFNALAYQQKTERQIKPNLPDVCIGTSAAPTYFPAHSFTDEGKGLKYHLIDGGVVANNPTMAAITTVTREQLKGNEYFHPGVDYKKYLVISIGTGSAVKGQGLYTAPICAKWGALNWIYNCRNSHNPIIDIFQHGSAVLVDWQVKMLLYNTDKPEPEREQNYLRIQAQAPLFGPDMLPMDAATPANMEKLVDIGNKLLKEEVAMVSLQTGLYNTCTGPNVPCNDDELERFAKLLSAERKLRLENEQKKSLLTKLKSLLHYIDITKAFTSSPPPLPCSSATTSISPAAHSQMPATEEEEQYIVESPEKETAVALKNVEYGFLNLVSC